MWLFKSPYGHRVTSDRNHDLVMAGSLSRLHLASSYLSDNFEAPKAMYPIVDTVQCECEVGIYIEKCIFGILCGGFYCVNLLIKF